MYSTLDIKHMGIEYSAWRESFAKIFAELEQEDYQKEHGRWGKYNEEWDEEPVIA